MIFPAWLLVEDGCETSFIPSEDLDVEFEVPVILVAVISDTLDVDVGTTQSIDVDVGSDSFCCTVTACSE